MAIKINFPATVFALLLLTELTTCTLSTATLQSASERYTRSSISREQNENFRATTIIWSQQNESTALDQQNENSSTTTKSPVDSQQSSTGNSSEPSTSTTGLRVLYRMASTFLDVIQPPGKNLYDELHMDSGEHSFS